MADVSAEQRAVVDRTNHHRRGLGLTAVRPTKELTLGAVNHSLYIKYNIKRDDTRTLAVHTEQPGRRAHGCVAATPRLFGVNSQRSRVIALDIILNIQ